MLLSLLSLFASLVLRHSLVHPAQARVVAPVLVYWSPEDAGVTTIASVLIDAPIEDLFAAYANLSRMTQWSPLLESVVHDCETGESEWALSVPRPLEFLARAAGMARLAITWRSMIIEERPPHLLRWRSLSGIANAGSASFEQSGSGVKMTLCLVYPLPVVVCLLVQSKLVQRFVEQTMRGTMRRFAEVMETEARELEEEGQTEDRREAGSPLS